MKISEIIRELEILAPPSLQEAYDNAGLIVGNPHDESDSALIALDLTDAVMEEAIRMKCNLIITHHPILFKPLKRLNTRHYTGRLIIKAIQNNIALYAAHTNLDSVKTGVSAALAEKLNLKHCKILSPRKDLLYKLVTFCPHDHAENVRQALFAAGAGKIGEYDACSFNVQGEGSFRASAQASPFVGRVNELHIEPETRIETIFPGYLQKQVISALLASHPYEEVAYDVYALQNVWNEVGFGMLGELNAPMDPDTFLKFLAGKSACKGIRYSPLTGKSFSRIAVCGGSGSFLIQEAIAAGADAFVTGDLKYHDFFEADNQIVLFDIGHYESEQFACVLISALLKEKFPNFANFISGENTNPVNYYF